MLAQLVLSNSVPLFHELLQKHVALPGWLEVASQTKALLSLHARTWQCYHITSKIYMSIPFHHFF